MSKIKESLYECFTPEGLNLYEELRLQKELSELSEKEKCLYYGISCSYGICDECDIAERS